MIITIEDTEDSFKLLRESNIPFKDAGKLLGKSFITDEPDEDGTVEILSGQGFHAYKIPRHAYTIVDLNLPISSKTYQDKANSIKTKLKPILDKLLVLITEGDLDAAELADRLIEAALVEIRFNDNLTLADLEYFTASNLCMQAALLWLSDITNG